MGLRYLLLSYLGEFMSRASFTDPAPEPKKKKKKDDAKSSEESKEE